MASKAARRKPQSKRIRYIRYFSQFVSLIILNAAILGVTHTGLVLPVNQPDTPYSVVGGTFYYLQTFIAQAVLWPLIIFAVYLLVGGIFGRAFCAWACPFGLVQDLCSAVPIQKQRPNFNTNKNLREIADFLLALTILICLLMALTDAREQLLEMIGDQPFSIIDPSATLFAGLPWMAYWETFETSVDWLTHQDPLLWARLLLLIFALVIPMFIPRAWCRWFCPNGAIMGRIGKFSLIGVGRKLPLCDHCGDCEKVCSMGVPILQYRDPPKIRDSMCTNCLDCVEACPNDAMHIKIG